MISAFFEKESGSLFWGYGVLAAKQCALSFLPLGGSAGGQLLGEVLIQCHVPKLAKKAESLGIFLAIVGFIAWLLALGSYFMHL